MHKRRSVIHNTPNCVCASIHKLFYTHDTPNHVCACIHKLFYTHDTPNHVCACIYKLQPLSYGTPNNASAYMFIMLGTHQLKLVYASINCVHTNIHAYRMHNSPPRSATEKSDFRNEQKKTKCVWQIDIKCKINFL
jgi:hypothetical protein